MPEDDGGQTLQRLINDHRGDRSYDRLSRDCGGLPTGKRLQQIATTAELRTFPDPDTIRGLARGLGVSHRDVVLASARSCGLAVPSGPAGSDLVLSDVGELPWPARTALVSLVQEMVVMARRLDGGDEGATVTRLRRPLGAAARPPERKSPKRD